MPYFPGFLGPNSSGVQLCTGKVHLATTPRSTHRSLEDTALPAGDELAVAGTPTLRHQDHVLSQNLTLELSIWEFVGGRMCL